MDKEELLRKVGDRIRAIRQEKGISQQELASLCNMEKSNMSRLEYGNTNATIYTLNKVAAALSITLSELVDF